MNCATHQCRQPILSASPIADPRGAATKTPRKGLFDATTLG
jgi:hypothetical protein